MVRIACKTADLLPLDAIEDLQGGLKKRSKKDIELITKSIEKYGFSFPFFVWKNGEHNYCLDGHGRRLALLELERKGEEIPPLPVVYIEAKDNEEAKQKLLRLNSQYGQMTKKSVLEFIGEMEIDAGEICLPSGVLEFEQKGEREQGEVEFTDYIDEENNFIVLKFTTDIDFLNAQTLFGIKTVKGLSTSKGNDNSNTFGHMGIGRVIDGVQAIKMLQGDRE